MVFIYLSIKQYENIFKIFISQHFNIFIETLNYNDKKRALYK